MNTQDGLSTGQDALTGASAGTAIAPGIGTAVGAGLGGLIGLFSGLSNNSNKEKQAARDATAMRFSPWAKISPSTSMSQSVAPTLLSGLLAGGKQGADIVNAANKNAVPGSPGAQGGAVNIAQSTGGDAPTNLALPGSSSAMVPAFNPWTSFGGQ